MTAFHDMDEHIGQLRGLAPRVLAAEEGCIEAVLRLARNVRRTIGESEDGSLAVVHLFNRYARPVELAIYHAVICEVLGRRMDIPEEAGETLIAAALTVNIPFWELQDELNIQNGALDDAQRAQVRAHPQQGVEMLEAAGVEDELWLRIARQHHEQPDGNGYPDGLQAAAIDPLAMVLHIAESYCAAVTDRDYRLARKRRKRYHATSVLHEFHQMQKRISAELLGLLIKNIGVYPPGTWVQLANQEIALVVRRQDKANSPVVASFGRKGHPPLPRPIMRDTSNSDYRVKAISPSPKQRARIHLSSLWVDK